VTRIRVVLEVVDVANDAGAKRIEMDVTNQLEEIALGLANDGLVAVLKEVPDAMVPTVSVIDNPES